MTFYRTLYVVHNSAILEIGKWLNTPVLLKTYFSSVARQKLSHRSDKVGSWVIAAGQSSSVVGAVKN